MLGSDTYFFMTGIEVSLEDMEKTVNDIFEENKKAIIEQRYRTNGMCFAASFT